MTEYLTNNDSGRMWQNTFLTHYDALSCHLSAEKFYALQTDDWNSPPNPNMFF
jgi:hypothetical protein